MAAPEKISTTRQVNLSMIRRFNHHSTMVLKAATLGSSDDVAAANGSAHSAPPDVSNGCLPDESSYSSWAGDPIPSKRVLSSILSCLLEWLSMRNIQE